MKEPIRVGILNDISNDPCGLPDIEQWLRIALGELPATQRLDRDVDFVREAGLGLPTGTAAAVAHAYERLVEKDVLLVVGPAIGDNALVATPLAEQHRVPTINWAGSERARGHYMFHLQVGSHEDEPVVLVRHLRSIGARRIGIVYDKSPIGRRYLHYFQAEAEIMELGIAAAVPIAPVADDAGVQMRELVDARMDSLVYLGLGVSAQAVAKAARASGWSGPCAMNTAGLRGYVADFAKTIDGWNYIDMFSDRNTTLSALCERHRVPANRKYAAAKGYDLGRLVAEGLARAPELTREGIKCGLEQIKLLAAAEGHDGTVLSFGNWDRGALHGRYLVLRTWKDGTSLEVETANRGSSRPQQQRRLNLSCSSLRQQPAMWRKLQSCFNCNIHSRLLSEFTDFNSYLSLIDLDIYNFLPMSNALPINLPTL